MTDKSIRDYINLIENAQTRGMGKTPTITLTQWKPGSWSRIAILVDGLTKFQAVKTIGPGHWTIFDMDGETIGEGSNKAEIKATVLSYMSTREAPDAQLEETSPEAIAKISEITRRP
jgi:hypothetical protein